MHQEYDDLNLEQSQLGSCDKAQSIDQACKLKSGQAEGGVLKDEAADGGAKHVIYSETQASCHVAQALPQLMPQLLPPVNYVRYVSVVYQGSAFRKVVWLA